MLPFCRINRGIAVLALAGCTALTNGQPGSELAPVEAAASAGAEAALAELTLLANNAWMLVATALVFAMHLGFAMLESGLTQAKNTVNILFKNTAIVGIGLLTYALCGFNLMYPGAEFAGGVFGFAGFGIGPPEGYDPVTYADGGYTYWTDFIFQGMFAATAATIVSGAVAERIRLGPFLAFSTLYVAVIYPAVGMWHWGGGWLAERGFHDFAGSTIVHSVGGWAALAGVLVLGPRLNKYIPVEGGKGVILRPIMGHSMPLAAIGVFLLWFGWFGFNGGSVLSADPESISLVFVTTSLAAAAGIVGAMIPSWIIEKKPDLSMTLNGVLAGLVGVTAGADVVTPMESIIIGFVAGVIVVFAIIALDRVRLDDPVGAISVHLICGIWGTLAAGIWGEGASLLPQLMGIGATALLCFPAALALFLALKHTVGLRVSRQEELGGLDIGEHGMEAYAGFQFFTTR
jgi:Amt family ammonium transporter